MGLDPFMCYFRGTLKLLIRVLSSVDENVGVLGWHKSITYVWKDYSSSTSG